MFNIAAIHLEGDAILRNDWFEHTHGIHIWRQFKSELLTRFGPSEHENHRCKKGRLLVIEPINGSEPKNVDLVSEEEDVKEELQPTVSTVHALAGYANPQTIKIDEFRKHQPITVLIDTGSTNNFMDNKVATRLTLRIEDCSRFDVKISGVCASADEDEALVNRGKGKASTAMVARLQQEGAMGPTKEEDGCGVVRKERKRLEREVVTMVALQREDMDGAYEMQTLQSRSRGEGRGQRRRRRQPITMTIANRGRRGQWKVGEAAVEKGATTTKEGAVGSVAASSRRLETTMLGRGYGKEGMIGSDEGGLCIVVGGSNNNAIVRDNVMTEEGIAGWGCKRQMGTMAATIEEEAGCSWSDSREEAGVRATLAEEEEMKRRRKQGVRRAVAAADVGDDRGNG
ncbi:hypothetical protein BHM03_00053234 [Ensete ventricosum]|nr:hypothetical protein BHM03_00053234 [Ensete ventricosum]